MDVITSYISSLLGRQLCNRRLHSRSGDVNEGHAHLGQAEAPAAAAAKTLSSRRSQARVDRRGAGTGRGGRRRGRQRARGGTPRRGVAGRAVPAFSEPSRAADGGGRGGAAA